MVLLSDLMIRSNFLFEFLEKVRFLLSYINYFNDLLHFIMFFSLRFKTCFIGILTTI